MKFSIQLDFKEEKKQTKHSVKKIKKTSKEKIISLEEFRKRVTEYRIEKDSIGEVKVPNDKLWGAQTQKV